MRFPGEDGGRSLAEMAQRDLVATLQLLAERAQYITGATGSAIALRDAEQMVCRASAGTSAPEVGAQLQVNSGLSGESVRTKQTLRCDDAATDPRVNRESCEALGIASVVVMPLVQGGDVIGVFELFSDKAHVFDSRDLAALERMGAMVFTALEQAAAGLSLGPSKQTLAGPAEQPASEARDELESTPSQSGAGGAFHMHAPVADPAGYLSPSDSSPFPGPLDSEDVLDVAVVASTAPPEMAIEDPVLSSHQTQEAGPRGSAIPAALENPDPGMNVMPEDAVTPPPYSAVANLRKCEGCGFPVSEGRHLCLDCEKKRSLETDGPAWSAYRPASATDVETQISRSSIDSPGQPQIPLFLGKDAAEASWLASHKYTVGAIAVAVLGIVALLFAR